jgi:hypothetical protein
MSLYLLQILDISNDLIENHYCEELSDILDKYFGKSELTFNEIKECKERLMKFKQAREAESLASSGSPNDCPSYPRVPDQA